MALGTLLFNQDIPSEFPFGYGLTIKDKLAVIADFGQLYDQWHQLETDNNLNNIGDFQADHNITSIDYSKDENLYWNILTYINTATPSVYNTRIQKRNDQGQLTGTLNFRDIIPAPDRYPTDWDSVIGTSITLSPDKTEIYGIFSRSKRVYRISKTGTYLGYFDLEGVSGTKKVGGITTDGSNIWYTVFEVSDVKIIEFFKADINGNTLDSFSVSNEDPEFSNLYYPFDLSFSDQTFENKPAIWLRTANGTLSEQALLAFEIDSPPCQDDPVISASDKTILLNSVFEPLNGVSAIDCSGQDITDLIIVKENDVDTSNLGVYTVTYQVTSSNEKTAEKTITVTVVDKIPLTREQSIIDVIESVALEQAALSHILNAEGEKIQAVVKDKKYNADEMLKVNKSVNQMVNTVSKLELVLDSKLELFQKCDVFCKNNNL